MVSDANWKLYS